MDTKKTAKKRATKLAIKKATENKNYRICINGIIADELVDLILSAFLDNEVGKKTSVDTN